jgi:ubiquinone/menaquinone biosynthesis C-methylase UbiE
MTTTGRMLPALLPPDQVARTYTRVAPIYDAWAALTETRARRASLARAAARDGETILEVAVGTGLAFAELARANPHGLTEGIDLTDAMLARARTKVAALPGRHRLRVGDARALDFPDGHVDLLINNYMFDLLPEDDFAGVLAEFFRVLAPGGRMVLTNMTRSDRLLGRIYEWIYRVRPALMGGCRGVELAEAVTAAGFTDLVRDTVFQLGFPSEILAARKPVAATAAR